MNIRNYEWLENHTRDAGDPPGTSARDHELGQHTSFSRDHMLDEETRSIIDRKLEHALTLGAKNREDFKRYLYADHLVDDLAAKMGISSIDRDALIEKIIRERADTIEEIVTIMGHLYKKAYKEMPINFKPEPAYDMKKWHTLLGEIRRQVAMGLDKIRAVHNILGTIPSLKEKIDFLDWFNIKTQSSVHGINASSKEVSRMTKIADQENSYGLYGWKEPIAHADEPRDGDIYAKEPQPAYNANFLYINEEDAVDFEAARSKMISRTFALDKLLERYRRVLKHDQIESIEDALNNLRKKIRQLKVATTIQDTIIKTARIFQAQGWEEGALELSRAMNPMPLVKQAEFGPDELHKVEEVMTQLGDISAMLRQRGIIRELATLDIDLYNLDLGSYFTELGDAQVKLMEAFNYAANKVDDLLPKIRSQYQKQTKPHMTPAHLQTQEFKPENLPISKMFEEEDKAKKEVAPEPTPPKPEAKIP